MPAGFFLKCLFKSCLHMCKGSCTKGYNIQACGYNAKSKIPIKKLTDKNGNK